MADDSTSVISSPILPISDVAEHEIPLPADSVAVDYKAFPDSIHLELDRNMRTLVEGDSIVEEGDSTAIIPEGMIPVDNCTNCATDSISPGFDPDYIVRGVQSRPQTRGMAVGTVSRPWAAIQPQILETAARSRRLHGPYLRSDMEQPHAYRLTQAYRDLMDSDPNTRSYMDFYPATPTSRN